MTPDVADRLREWLSDGDLNAQRLSAPDEALSFRVGSVVVTRPPEGGQTVVGLTVALSATDRSRLLGLTAQQVETLRRDLAWLLHGRAVAFRLLEEGGIPAKLTLLRVIFDDGLSKDRLLACAFEIEHVAAMASMTIARTINTGPEPQVPPAPPAEDLGVTVFQWRQVNDTVELTWGEPLYDSRRRQLVTYQIVCLVQQGNQQVVHLVANVEPLHRSYSGLPVVAGRIYGCRAYYRLLLGERGFEEGPTRWCV